MRSAAGLGIMTSDVATVEKESCLMKTGIAVVAAAIMVLGGWAWAGSEDTNQPPQALRLEVELADGSRVIGVPGVKSVPFDTAYGKIDIPLEQIASMEMTADHETAALDLRNNDRLKGVLKLSLISLETVFGGVRIGMEHVSRITVVRPGLGLAAGLRRSLVLHYAFDADDSGKVRDSSGNGRNGVLRGAKWVPDGCTGGGCMFNGQDAFLDAGTPPAQPGSLTVAAWIRTSRADDLRWVVSRSSWQSGAWQLMTANGRGAAEFDPGGMFNGRRVVTDGKWHHLVAVYDDTTYARTLYVDGEFDAEDKGRGKFRENANPVYVGKRPDVQACFEGAIDEVMLFDRALSAAEVRQVYGAGREMK